MVSHDRYLVERVCDTVVALFGDGQDHAPARAGSRSTWRGGAAAGDRGRGAAVRRRPAADAAGPSGHLARPSSGRPARRRSGWSGGWTKLSAAREEAARRSWPRPPPTRTRLLALDAELRAVMAEREEVELEWLAAAELAES